MVNTSSFLDAIKTLIKNKIKTYTYGALGTGTRTESQSDTALQNEILRKQNYRTQDLPDKVILGIYLSLQEGNGYSYTEVGWFDANTGGNMLMRKVFNAVNKTDMMELIIEVEEEVSVT